jgi:hypothetical protein
MIIILFQKLWSSCKLNFPYNLWIVSAIKGATRNIVNLSDNIYLSNSFIWIVSVKYTFDSSDIPIFNEALLDSTGWVAYAIT